MALTNSDSIPSSLMIFQSFLVAVFLFMFEEALQNKKRRENIPNELLHLSVFPLKEGTSTSTTSKEGKSFRRSLFLYHTSSRRFSTRATFDIRLQNPSKLRKRKAIYL